ncbi:response regulator [Fulvimarina sp. MAC8]|uniref:response regulator n=1 Tax=Fulvimarina sp. MAC8 TaxID=3162874 RepID=UPI0032EC7BAB
MTIAAHQEYSLSAPASPGASGHSADAKPRSLDILIVEDEILIAMDVEQSVEEAGHKVMGIETTASSAVKAVEMARPDVVLMDLKLADGSFGGDAAREILQRFGIHSIFISGNLDSATRSRLADLEPIAMLSKPFRAEELLQALRSVMQTQN